MTEGYIISLMRSSVSEIIRLILPVLGLALIVGLIIGILQAVTSIQEQTLTFLPKLIVILITIALLAGTMFASMRGYTVSLFNSIAGM